MTERRLSTGLPGLDYILKGVLAGDNIVWQIDNIEDYAELVRPYCADALRQGHRVIYFRFASHDPLLTAESGVEIHAVDPALGFESFVSAIHAVIATAGRGAFYVFDCLSELAVTWYSDQMLGNFFLLTCPYLYDLETVTYFAYYRNYHSFYATTPITHTAQLVLDIYRHRASLYVRPLKVQHRFSPTMHLLHVWEGDRFVPITASTQISEILTAAKWSGLNADRRPSFWERAFEDAQEIAEGIRAGRRTIEEERGFLQRLLKMVVTRDDKMLPLAQRYMTFEDVLDIRRRMIGTGLVGGKAVGMLLARAILRKAGARFATLLESHDSFFVGSDVFYTFLVRNGVWWVRQQQRDPARFLEGAEQARRRLLTGEFPSHVLAQFEEMLDYFGQSPIIVRSSSLLEDNFGNAFAGKYDSVFCANQGSRQRRLEDFVAAMRTIYASSMSERALHYRARRNMLDKDEQMAILVMRVSGDMFGRHFLPPVAGVGFSFNPYVWHEEIDPKAGVIRLVFGLGTRAVNRSDDDYTRIVALNAPERRPEQNFDQVTQYAQRNVDYLDLEANQLVTGHFLDLLHASPGLPLRLTTSDLRVSEDSDQRIPVLTFEPLLAGTRFVTDLRDMLSTLQQAYDYAVDIEFTVNFAPDGQYRINLVQCRPLQVRGDTGAPLPALQVPPADCLLEAHGAVVGLSRILTITHVVYVEQEAYGALTLSDRYEVAHVIGQVNGALPASEQPAILLIGPGRWGTSSPELGIPVTFHEIRNVAVICEVVGMRGDLIPDCSLGTHFLNELVEMDMLYLAMFPGQAGNRLDPSFFREAPNHLASLVPGAERWCSTIRVVRVADTLGAGVGLTLAADASSQRVVCFKPAAAAPQAS